MSWQKHRSNNKYGMSPNGSKLEKSVGEMLRLREMAGELRDVKEQVRVQICCQNPDCEHKMRIQSIVDFSAFDVKANETIYIEAKGLETTDYRIKRRLWMHFGAGPLHVYKGSYHRFTLSEVIIPKCKSERNK